MTPETEDLVRSATRWAAVPFVPEVTLLTAAEPFGLWDRTALDAPPFWAFPWAGGQGLARYILDHPETVAGRSVLDMASGSGLVAIAAAKAGARSVLAGDIDDNALAAVALNAAANAVPAILPCHIDFTANFPGDPGSSTLGAPAPAAPTPGAPAPEARALGTPAPAAPTPGAPAPEARALGTPASGAPTLGTAAPGTFTPGTLGGAGGAEVVLAADVFYQRDLATLALRFLRAARRAGAEVLAADPGRAFVPREALTVLASYQVPVLTVLEDASVKEVTVYRLR